MVLSLISITSNKTQNQFHKQLPKLFSLYFCIFFYHFSIWERQNFHVFIHLTLQSESERVKNWNSLLNQWETFHREIKGLF